MCTTFIAKFVLGIINTLIFLLGAGMFVIGLLIHTQPSFSQKALSSLLAKLEETAAQAGVTLDTSAFSAADVAYSFTIAIMVIGLFLATVSVLGLIGVKYGIKVVLIVYFVITLVLFLAQVALVLIAVIDRSKFDNAVKPRLKDTIDSNFAGIEGTDAASMIWNGVMAHLQCCGVDNYEDFTTAAANGIWTKTINGTVYPLVTPVACCKTVASPFTCATAPSDSNSNWKTGCYTKIWDFLISNSGIVIGIAAGVLVAQLIILILTYMVMRDSGKVSDVV